MKIRKLANYALVKIGASGAIFLTLDGVAMSTHAPFNPDSPYFAASIYFGIQTVVMMFSMFVDDFEDYSSPESLALASKILSPIKLVTAISIISFASLKEVPILMIGLVFLLVVWLLATGATGMLFHWVKPISKSVMANHRTAQTTRSEDALLKDLAHYLKADLS